MRHTVGRTQKPFSFYPVNGHHIDREQQAKKKKEK